MTFEAGQLELPLGIQVSMASFDLAGHTFSFSGHETFVFRYAWLKKAVDAVRVDPRVFGQDNAIVTLGVGKKQHLTRLRISGEKSTTKD